MSDDAKKIAKYLKKLAAETDADAKAKLVKKLGKLGHAVEPEKASKKRPADGDGDAAAAAPAKKSKKDKKEKKSKKDKDAAAAAPAALRPDPGTPSIDLVKYPPILEFADPRVPAVWTKACAAAGYKAPTEIQQGSWPPLFGGRDAIGIAETGSGKTVAFGLPGLNTCRRGAGLQMLVLCPTRELAMQGESVLASFSTASGLTVACVVGGVPKGPQKRQLAAAECVVATPGRLVDLVINEQSASLANVAFAVLDEADRMLDMGFAPDVRALLNECSKSVAQGGKRQTCMFSATWPVAVRRLASEFMHDPVRIAVSKEGDEDGANPGDVLQANKRVKQTVEVMDEHARARRLDELLAQYATDKTTGKQSGDRILIFCLYKKETARVEAKLRRDGWKVGGVHGDKAQADRTAAVNAFRDGSTPMLVATDVAARGLDIPDVQVVINFAFPLTVEDYVHRIGRTGRAGKTGIAHTLFHDGDKGLAAALVGVLRDAGQEIPAKLLAFPQVTKNKPRNEGGYAVPLGKTGMDMTKKGTRIKFN